MVYIDKVGGVLGNALVGLDVGDNLIIVVQRFGADIMAAYLHGSHAIRVAIDEALKCKETGEEKTIVFGLTGTGYFDMVAYEKFNNGEMSDDIPTDADLEIGFKGLPDIPEK